MPDTARNVREVFDQFWRCIAEERFVDAQALVADDFELHLPSMATLDVHDAIGAARMWRGAFANFGDPSSRIVKMMVEAPRAIALVLEEELLHTGRFMNPGGPALEPADPPRRVFVKSTHVLLLTDDGLILNWDISFDPGALTVQMQ